MNVLETQQVMIFLAAANHRLEQAQTEHQVRICELTIAGLQTTLDGGSAVEKETEAFRALFYGGEFNEADYD